MKRAITEAWLASYTLPDGTEREMFWDASLPGFGVQVGRRFSTFRVQARVNGVQSNETIGRYGRPGPTGDVWTVARARREAMRRLGAMSEGVEPEREKSKPTLRDAFDAHIARLRNRGRAQGTIDTIEKSMRYLESWLDRPIAELTTPALIELHERIRRDAKPRANARNAPGAAVANRVIVNVGTAWNTLNRQLAGELGTWNPAEGVDKLKLEPKRVRIVDLADWHKRVQTMRNPIQRDGLMFALFTGLRSEDVRTVRWEHADLEERTLRLPDPKGGAERAFTIPLSQTCVDILERRQRENEEHPLFGGDDRGWAFPAVNSDGEVGPIGDLRQQSHDSETGAHSRFPAEDVHTLRRTYESVAQEAGVSELDQHVLTNHSYGSHNVNATYIAQHIDHLRTCQDRIEAALWARIKPAPKTKRKARGKLRAV